MRACLHSTVFDTCIIEILAALSTIDKLLCAVAVVTDYLLFSPFVDFQTEHGKAIVKLHYFELEFCSWFHGFRIMTSVELRLLLSLPV